MCNKNTIICCNDQLPNCWLVKLYCMYRWGRFCGSGYQKHTGATRRQEFNKPLHAAAVLRVCESKAEKKSLLEAQSLLGGVVKHQHHRGTDGTESIGGETLVKRPHALVLDNAREAMAGALIQTVFRGLLGLHLEAATNGIEGVSGGGGAQHSGLGGGEGGQHTHDAKIIFVRVQANDGIEGAELDTTVGNNTHDGDTETVVEGQETALGDGLSEAIAEAFEITLAGTDIGSEAGTGVIQGVDDGEGRGTGGTAGREIRAEELPELCLGIVSGEQLLDLILEGKIEGLGWEITDNVGAVATPEGAHALLGLDTSEGIANAGVTGHLARSNSRVGVLCLDDQLDTLDGGRGGLGDSAGPTSQKEIHQKTGLVATGFSVTAHIGRLVDVVFNGFSGEKEKCE